MSKGVLKFGVLWLLIAAAAVFFLFGFNLTGRPLWQWLMVLVVGPPALLMLQATGELLGELFQRIPGIRHGNEYVERKAQGRSTSGTRIAWYLLTMLIACALVAGITWLIRGYQ